MDLLDYLTFGLIFGYSSAYLLFAPYLGHGLGVSFGAEVPIVLGREITSVLLSVGIIVVLSWVYLPSSQDYGVRVFPELNVYSVCRRRLVSFGLERVTCCISVCRVHTLFQCPKAVLCEIQVLESLEELSEIEER